MIDNEKQLLAEKNEYWEKRKLEFEERLSHFDERQ
jgi:hypothetical protein